MKRLPNCKVCGKERTIPKKTYASRAAYESDEFCARACCEQDHGITHPKGYCSRDYGMAV